MKSKRNKILIVSSTRADFGILSSLIELLKIDKNYKTIFCATGTHLSSQFGNTIDEAHKLDITPDLLIKIPIGIKQKSLLDKTYPSYIKKFYQVLSKNRPNLLFLLGDRVEIFLISFVAYNLRIPIAHIHGGEVTYGSLDDNFRHSISKMANLHFVASNIYKKRLIQLGEDKNKIFNVGALGIDSIRSFRNNKNIVLENKYQKFINKKFFLVTLHPDTTKSLKNNIENTKILISALIDYQDIDFIFTGSNADIGGFEISKLFKKVCIEKKNFYYSNSLGRNNFFGLLKFSKGIIGNSSSGIIEAPYFNLPTINIGSRQQGRVMSNSIVTIPFIKTEIKTSIDRILDNNHLIKNTKIEKPFGNFGVAKRIIKILNGINLNDLNSDYKIFNDL